MDVNGIGKIAGRAIAQYGQNMENPEYIRAAIRALEIGVLSSEVASSDVIIASVSHHGYTCKYHLVEIYVS